jgi:hypothetical protein
LRNKRTRVAPAFNSWRRNVEDSTTAPLCNA